MKTGRLVICVVLSMLHVPYASAQGDTAFTYQGELTDNGSPANGNYDFDFSLWDGANDTDTQIGSTVVMLGVQVVDGRFTVELDFGASAFDNSERWLAIVVDGFTLSPRTQLTRAPYAIQTRGVFVDDDKRVGIGTVSPSVETEVHIQANTGDNFGVLVDSFGVPASSIGLHTGPSGYASLAKNAFFVAGWDRFDDAQGAFLQEIDPTGNTTFWVAPSGVGPINWTSALRLNADGKVGVGTTAPNYGLHVESDEFRGVYANNTSSHVASMGLMGETINGRGVFGLATGTSGLNYGVMGSTNSPDGFAGYFLGRGYVQDQLLVGRLDTVTSSEWFGVHAPVGDGAYGGIYVSTDTANGRPFYGYAPGESASMWHYYDGSTGDWHVYNNGIALTVTDIGRVGIGTTTPTAQLEVESSTTAVRADTTGTTAIFGRSTANSGFSTGGSFETFSTDGQAVRARALANFGTNIGVHAISDSASGYDFYAGGAGVDYGTSSSRRWKHNIERINDPLYKLSKLRGVYFDWDEEHGGHHDVGFIAEEVGAVLPEIVQYEENGIDAHGMDYSKTTPLLVEAVNALQSNHGMAIAMHDDELARLTLENNELRSRLAKLEAAVERMVTTGPMAASTNDLKDDGQRNAVGGRAQ